MDCDVVVAGTGPVGLLPAADGEPDSPGIDDLHDPLRRWFGNPRR